MVEDRRWLARPGRLVGEALLSIPLPKRQPEANPAAGLQERSRFIQGFLTASLVFCVGPMTILGSMQDGLDR